MASPSTETGVSSAKLLFGREIQTRLHFIKRKLSVSDMQGPTSSRDIRNLEVGDMVKIRNYTDKRK